MFVNRFRKRDKFRFIKISVDKELNFQFQTSPKISKNKALRLQSIKSIVIFPGKTGKEKKVITINKIDQRSEEIFLSIKKFL